MAIRKVNGRATQGRAAVRYATRARRRPSRSPPRPARCARLTDQVVGRGRRTAARARSLAGSADRGHGVAQGDRRRRPRASPRSAERPRLVGQRDGGVDRAGQRQHRRACRRRSRRPRPRSQETAASIQHVSDTAQDDGRAVAAGDHVDRDDGGAASRRSPRHRVADQLGQRDRRRDRGDGRVDQGRVGQRRRSRRGRRGNLVVDQRDGRVDRGGRGDDRAAGDRRSRRRRRRSSRCRARCRAWRRTAAASPTSRATPRSAPRRWSASIQSVSGLARRPTR